MRWKYPAMAASEAIRPANIRPYWRYLIRPRVSSANTIAKNIAVTVMYQDVRIQFTILLWSISSAAQIV